jgi:hypothetical protein
MAEITLPHLLELKNLGRQFLDMADKAGAAGDTTTQQQMLMLNWEIGEKLHSATDKVPIITELVGVAMENATLRGWPSGLSFGDRTAGDILAGNIAERKELQTAAPVFDKWFPSAPEDEIAAYVDAVKSIGERQAFSWLKSQHPEFAQIQPPSN